MMRIPLVSAEAYFQKSAAGSVRRLDGMSVLPHCRRFFISISKRGADSFVMAVLMVYRRNAYRRSRNQPI